MSKSKPTITIIGLGLVGTSIGLALKKSDIAATVIGHDLDASTGKRAKKLGAIDKAQWRLFPACEEADLIIMAMPPSGIEETLRDIGPELQPGTVIMDTASLKAPVLGWADEYLADGVHFVGTDPIIAADVDGGGGMEAARADLFEKGVFCVTPSPKADQQAIKQVTNLIAFLGSSPVFYDPYEHDGLLAAAEHLPSLISLALLDTVVHGPTWRELRKVAGPDFESATRAAGAEPISQSELLVGNRDNILRWLDSYTAALASLRQDLVDQDEEHLSERFNAAGRARAEWMHMRSSGSWDERPQTEMPAKPNLMDTFLGSFWRRKPPEKSS